MSRGKAAQIGWRAFGWQSQRYLRKAEIFHVRSGAGQAGAIRKAKLAGMKVVVDHSIAHPAFMEQALKPEYNTFGLPFDLGPRSLLWRLVLADAAVADCLLVNSEFVRETFAKEGYPLDKIRIVHLGVREDFFSLKEAYPTWTGYDCCLPRFGFARRPVFAAGPSTPRPENHQLPLTVGGKR
jgi:hypothetical protein